MDSPGASWGRRTALGRPPSGLPAFGAAAVAGDETGHEVAQSGQTLVAETAVPGLPINLREAPTATERGLHDRHRLGRFRHER